MTIRRPRRAWTRSSQHSRQRLRMSTTSRRRMSSSMRPTSITWPAPTLSRRRIRRWRHSSTTSIRCTAALAHRCRSRPSTTAWTRRLRAASSSARSSTPSGLASATARRRFPDLGLPAQGGRQLQPRRCELRPLPQGMQGQRQAAVPELRQHRRAVQSAVLQAGRLQQRRRDDGLPHARHE